MRGRKGFSLVEAMVVLVLMVFIMSSVYLMIMYFRDVSGTEQAKVRQTQESRYLLSVFSSELKNAGSVLTLANSGGFLSVSPYFNGIYPLNNFDFPDGVILASGDPNAVAKLTDAYTPSSGNDLKVFNTNPTPSWAVGDKGILIGPNGFYVFTVADVNLPTITREAVPVYYSGLLHTTHYDDPETTLGNTVTYPVNAPVMRLADFSIYLVNERYDAAKGRKVRDLVRVTDCKDKGTENDIFGAASTAVKGVITENVWDLQLGYTAYPNFPDVTYDPNNNFFTGGTGVGTRKDLLDAFRSKTFKEITVSVVALTDDYPGKGSVTYQLPLLADRAATSLPSGKFNYKTYSFLIEPRNYNIKF